VIEKLNRNKERDQEVTQYYEKNNWNIIKIWENEIKSDMGSTINEIVEFLEKSKR
jgi:DNA mismatch endonuclease, patch repair protein